MKKTISIMNVEVDYTNINAVNALVLLSIKVREAAVELMITDIIYDDLRKYAMICNAFRDSVHILAYISVIDDDLQNRFEMEIIRTFERAIPEEYHVDFTLALSEGVEF